MLRLRRKQQKATTRLNNFINKQTTREDSITFSYATDENRLSPVTGQKEEPWTSLIVKGTPLNFLKNEQQNANNEENKHHNTSEKPQKDILVDSSYLHLHATTTEALMTNTNHFSDKKIFHSLIISLKISLFRTFPQTQLTPITLNGLVWI